MAATNVGMLTGRIGNLGPTRGFSILVASKRTTKLLTLIMIPTVGFHAGVAGTFAAAASKFDEIKLYLLNGKMNVDLQNYKVTQETTENN